MAKKHKRPVISAAPTSQKTIRVGNHALPSSKEPRFANAPESLDREKISWGVKLIEREGPWGWSRIERESLWNEILRKLGEYETMTWGEIKGSRCHSIAVNSLSPSAKKRLAEINQDDVEDLFSLRLGGTERVFGIRERNVMKILWWDPNHEVCISNKKNT